MGSYFDFLIIFYTLVDKKQVPVLKESTIVYESIYTVGKHSRGIDAVRHGKEYFVSCER